MKNRISTVLSILLLSLASFSVYGEVVNLNKADAAAFQQHLTGIGPVKAQAIVKYRSKNGSFKSLDDLKEVPGIGNELLKSNRKLLSLKSGVTKGDAKAVKKSAAKKSTDSKKTTAKKSADTKKKAVSTATDSKKKSVKKTTDKKEKSAKKSASDKKSSAKSKVSDTQKKVKKKAKKKTS